MKNIFQFSSQKGTSLNEVILYIALFSIIILVVFDLLITSGSLKTESESQLYLQKESNFIRSQITFAVRNADAISSPAAIGQASNSLSVVNGVENYNFSLSAGNLVYQKTIGVNSVNATLNSNLTSVSNLSFQGLGFLNGKLSLKASFTLTEKKSTQSGNQTKDYQFIVTQR